MIRRNAFIALAALSLSMAVALPPAAHAATATVAAPANPSPAATPAPVPAPAPAAQDVNRTLKECAAQAESDPVAALDRALRWQDSGGGDYARLCQALARFHKGEFKAAGEQLETLAPLLGKDDPKAAAAILARGGWAWLRAGNHTKAETLYSAALAKQPGDVDLLIDRAFARAEAERFWDAVADLDAALAADPKRADAYLYRAAAHKALSNHRQALADIDRALELKPGDPETILLRGNVKALSGSVNAAREDWALVKRLAPDSAFARAAAVNLDRAAKMASAPPEKPSDKTTDKPADKPKTP